MILKQMILVSENLKVASDLQILHSKNCAFILKVLINSQQPQLQLHMSAIFLNTENHNKTTIAYIPTFVKILTKILTRF